MQEGRAVMECRAARRSGVLQPPSPPLILKQNQASRSSMPGAARLLHPTLAPSQNSGVWRKCPDSLSWVQGCHHVPTRPSQNRGLSSFILQSGLSRDEHRLLEMLEGSPCVSRGVKPSLREGPGQPSCADRSEAAPRVTCCPGRGSPDSGSLRLSFGFPRGCSPPAV